MTPTPDTLRAALDDVRSFVAEEPAREGAGLHYAVSQVRILDYIDSKLAALQGDAYEPVIAPLRRALLRIFDMTENQPDIRAIASAALQGDADAPQRKDEGGFVELPSSDEPPDEEERRWLSR